jgi:hypothetical protein
MKKLFSLILIYVVLFGCSKSSAPISSNSNSIIGIWELDSVYDIEIDSLINPPSIIKNDTTTKHLTIQFSVDSTFTTTDYTQIPPTIIKGTYTITPNPNGLLTLMYINMATADTNSDFYNISGNRLTVIRKYISPSLSQNLTISYTRQ